MTPLRHNTDLQTSRRTARGSSSLWLTRQVSETLSTTTRGELIHTHRNEGTQLISSWKPIVDNIESRFDAYLEQENRVNRSKLVDNRVHACIYFIQPTGHS